MGVLPLRHRDNRDRPEIDLAGPLEIAGIVELFDGRIGGLAVGQVVGETQRTDGSFQGFSLRRHTGSDADHTKTSQRKF
jgi:hypothetical protein